MFPLCRADTNRLATIEQHLLNRFVEPDFRAQFSGYPCHAVAERVATAERVKHAMLVLQKRQDREQARTLEGRHPEIFRLESERQLQPRIFEITREFLV